MAFPDTITLDKDGGTTDRAYEKRTDGIYMSVDSDMSKPHDLLIAHTTLNGKVQVDKHRLDFLRTEEDGNGDRARAELKVVLNVPRGIITRAHIDELLYSLADFFTTSTNVDRFLRSEL